MRDRELHLAGRHVDLRAELVRRQRPAAPGPSPSGSSGVSQLRFANLRDGWAYGPALYETSGGGWPWHHEDTNGQRVIDVEASPARAFAVFGACTGTGSNYAASCTSFSLWTSVPGTRTWTPVSVPSAYSQMQSTSSAAPLLVISGDGTGYLLTPSGEVLAGPATAAGGMWHAAGQAPCNPGPSDVGWAAVQSAATQFPAAQLAAGQKLFLSCASHPAGGSAQIVLYTSADGATWQKVGNIPASGTPTSLASAASGQVGAGHHDRNRLLGRWRHDLAVGQPSLASPEPKASATSA